MNRWHEFLESLATKGGNVALLAFFTVLTLVFLVHVSYHPVFGPEIRTLALTSFTGFSAALLNTLTGGPRPVNGNTKPPDPNAPKTSA
jgi:hypothetical protein